MFKDEADFEKVVGRLNIDTEPNPEHRDKLRRQMLSVFNATEQQSPAEIAVLQTLQSITTKIPMTRLITAAVILIAFVLAITLLEKSVQTTYSMEQTIEAFRKVRFLHVVMQNNDSGIFDERWIEIGPDGRQLRYRQESEGMGMSLLIVDNRQTCFFYYRNQQTVVLYDPNDQQFLWIFNLHKFFRDAAGDRTLNVEENVDYKGRRAHRVHRHEYNQDCYIDPETKLPIAWGPYDLFYDEPTEGTFDYVIPEGVIVVDKRPGAKLTPEPQWMIRYEEAKTYFKDAKVALANGDYVKAVELFTKTAEIQPNSNWVLFWLGKAYYELGDYDAAVNWFSKVIDLFGDINMVPHYCHLARGLTYQAKGMAEMAQRDFDIALPVMIDALRNIEESDLFDFADDPMHNERSEKEKPNPEQVQLRMIERLREVSGQNFGYDPNASTGEREKAIAAWENWWQQKMKTSDKDR